VLTQGSPRSGFARSGLSGAAQLFAYHGASLSHGGVSATKVDGSAIGGSGLENKDSLRRPPVLAAGKSILTLLSKSMTALVPVRKKVTPTTVPAGILSRRFRNAHHHGS